MTIGSLISLLISRYKRQWKNLCIMRVLLFAPALLSFAADQQSSASSPAQPLPFSHKTHLTFHLSCIFCHANPEPGNQMTLPATQTCMGCHARVATDRSSIQQLAKFAESREPIPWKPIYSIPAFVYWSHRTHLQAGVSCENCHGDVAQMEVIVKAKNVTTMAGCVACHHQKDAPTGCETCHESQSSLLPSPRRLATGLADAF